MNVLSSCDGIATWAIMLRAAGWRIQEYRAIEIDPIIRSIAISNFSNIIHVQPADITNSATHVEALKDGFIPDVFASSARCEPFSRARNKPGGFEDEASATFVSSAALVEKCRNLNVKFAGVS